MKQIDGNVNDVNEMSQNQRDEDEGVVEDDVDNDRLFLDSIQNGMDGIDATDLPTSLIVTSLDTRIFSCNELRSEFEGLFKKFEEGASIQYFKSFRRARVNFEDAHHAANARIRCHEMRVGDNIISCYFAQPMVDTEKKDKSHLQPPSPVRRFLISPPASPPVGWEPVHEGEPLINYELLAALSQLTPGEAHELHPQSESHPGIVVHVCEDENALSAEVDSGGKAKTKIQQTRRPPNRSTSEGSEDSICVTPP